MNLAHPLHVVLAIEKYADVFRGDFSGGGGSGVVSYAIGSFHGER